MAAELSTDPALEVENVSGSFGDLHASVDGRVVIDHDMKWYPTPTAMVTAVRTALAAGTRQATDEP